MSGSWRWSAQSRVSRSPRAQPEVTPPRDSDPLWPALQPLPPSSPGARLQLLAAHRHRPQARVGHAAAVPQRQAAQPEAALQEEEVVRSLVCRVGGAAAAQGVQQNMRRSSRRLPLPFCYLPAPDTAGAAGRAPLPSVPHPLACARHSRQSSSTTGASKLSSEMHTSCRTRRGAGLARKHARCAACGAVRGNRQGRQAGRQAGGNPQSHQFGRMAHSHRANVGRVYRQGGGRRGRTPTCCTC